ncbi:MAG: tyrosine-type recombinase/integrase [Proteobacteria bacterium]|nr:tyrosine-type recombinase/integrase [Pseudomonadota bacterium]
MSAPLTATFGSLLQQFFVERMIQQRHASVRTIEAYRDSFRLLLAFARQRLHKRPAAVALEDLSASFILQFLEHLETNRRNSVRSRNARFAAIRSFMHYVGFKEPAALALVRSVLAIPMKRFDRPLIGFLSREHMQAILNAPSPVTWCGQRDRVMLATLYNTGARVCELIGMRVADLSFESGPAIHIRGKGRKERSVPLWPSTAKQLRGWLLQYPREPHEPLFINRSGGALTRVGITERLKIAAGSITHQHPHWAKKRISPHVVRHSLAMHLLQSGVDITVIALWLGHESPVTTHMYVEADLQMKQRALDSLRAPRSPSTRYRPPDQLLRFLQSL